MKVVAVPGRYGGALQIGVLVQIAVLPAVDAAELIVVEFLKPVSSHIVVGRKTHHVTGQRTVGIFPPVLVLEPDAPQAGPRLRIFGHLLEGAHLLVLHPFRHHIIGRIGMLRNVLPHHRRVDTEAFAQRFQRRLQILLFFHQDLRVKNDIVDLVADCQDRAVGILDIATFKRYCRGVIPLLRQYLLLILFSVVSRDQIQLGAQPCEDQQHHQKKHHQFLLHLDRKSVTEISFSSPTAQLASPPVFLFPGRLSPGYPLSASHNHCSRWRRTRSALPPHTAYPAPESLSA